MHRGSRCSPDPAAPSPELQLGSRDKGAAGGLCNGGAVAQMLRGAAAMGEQRRRGTCNAGGSYGGKAVATGEQMLPRRSCSLA